jgi:hypothetical protein
MVGDETGKLGKALDQGVVEGVSKAYKGMVIIVGKFKEGLEIIFNGERLSTDFSGRWARRVQNISGDVLQRGSTFLEEVANQEGDPLKPLRGVLE